jgi:hypothetical protein
MSGKTRVGYIPYSKNLEHPGDRRRIVICATANKLDINTDNPLNSDLLLLSNGANFNYWIKMSRKPVILDLVDAYLGENPNWIRDFLRNIIRTINGKASFFDITYTRGLKKACIASDAVIVATPEQRDCILPYNKNVYVILDDHSELNSSNINKPIDREKSIFWEGMGYTLKHFKVIAPDLDSYLFKNSYSLYLLTNESFARWGGYLGKVESSKLIRKWFPKSFNQIKVIPWSIENVLEYSNRSEFAIIPIDTDDNFANLKPENKLLGLWALGLPVLFSNTPAYKRVAKEAGLMDGCINREEWKQSLDKHDFLTDQSYMKLANKYLESHHTKEVLIQKWEAAISTTLSKSQSREE